MEYKIKNNYVSTGVILRLNVPVVRTRRTVHHAIAASFNAKTRSVCRTAGSAMGTTTVATTQTRTWATAALPPTADRG